MKITKQDPFTGKSNTYDLDITQEQLDNWQNGNLIQKAMPNLSADEREFLISGMPIGKFDEVFKEEEEPTFAEHEKEKYQNGDMRDEDEEDDFDNDFELSSIEDIEIYEDYDEDEDEYLTDDELGLTQM